MNSTKVGGRVVSNQRILQAVSDPFLGYVTFEGYGFYVRQFRDRNVSFDIDRMSEQTFLDYGYACGSILARAHSRSAGGAFIAGYMGRGDVLPEAVTTWAEAYADQSFADYEALQAAVVSGRYEAAPL